MGPPASRSGYLLLRCAIYRLDFVTAAGLTGRCTEARDVPQTLPPRDTDAGERVMKQALQQMLGDLLSAILFLIVYAVSGSLFVAVAIAVTAGFMQFAFLRLMRRRIEPMQWMSLGLVVVLGGATMLTQSQASRISSSRRRNLPDRSILRRSPQISDPDDRKFAALSAAVNVPLITNDG